MTITPEFRQLLNEGVEEFKKLPRLEVCWMTLTMCWVHVKFSRLDNAKKDATEWLIQHYRSAGELDRPLNRNSFEHVLQMLEDERRLRESELAKNKRRFKKFQKAKSEFIAKSTTEFVQEYRTKVEEIRLLVAEWRTLFALPMNIPGSGRREGSGEAKCDAQ